MSFLRTFIHAAAWIVALLPIASMAQPSAVSGRQSFAIGVLPNISARVLLPQYQPWAEHFSRELGRKAEVVTAANFRAFAEATRRGDYDLIVTAPNLGRLAQVDSLWAPLASYEPRIPALLVASVSNRENAPAQIKGKSLALANPQSLVALAGIQWLEQQGVRAADYKVAQVANDDSLGTLLVSGEAPLAMMSGGEFRAKPEAMRKSLRIVTEMAQLPGFMVMANPALPVAERAKLRELVLAFPGTEAGARFLAASGFTGIKPVDERDLKFLDAFTDTTRRSLFPGN